MATIKETGKQTEQEGTPPQSGETEGQGFRTISGGKIMSGATAEKWENVKHTAQEAMERARHRAVDVAGRAQETMNAAAENVGTVVKKYPFQSILAGFGFGLILGALMRFRRRV